MAQPPFIRIMKVTKYQRKRENERDQHFENNKELLSYPYLTVVSILHKKECSNPV